MADTENREDQKISECLREAFGYSDDQLLKQLDQANETFKDVNFTGAEDRLMKRFLARKAELEKETASQTPTLVPQNESANIQIAEELPKKTVTVISEAEEKKKNEKKVIRFGKKKVLATAALVAVIAGMLGGTAIGKKSYFFRRDQAGDAVAIIDNDKNIKIWKLRLRWIKHMTKLKRNWLVRSLDWNITLKIWNSGDTVFIKMRQNLNLFIKIMLSTFCK